MMRALLRPRIRSSPSLFAGRAHSSAAAPKETLPERVDCVIVGGGIIGASAAWQLSLAGRSVLVLEQNTLTSGTTWHAAGLCATVKGHEAMVSLVRRCEQL